MVEQKSQSATVILVAVIKKQKSMDHIPREPVHCALYFVP
jgi:hypothetical protein